jgi:hypothetical protein
MPSMRASIYRYQSTDATGDTADERTNELPALVVTAVEVIEETKEVLAVGLAEDWDELWDAYDADQAQEAALLASMAPKPQSAPEVGVWVKAPALVFQAPSDDEWDALLDDLDDVA